MSNDSVNIHTDMGVFVQASSPLYGMTTGESMNEGFFVREGWGRTHGKPKDEDRLVPLDVIELIKTEMGRTSMHLTWTRQQLAEAPTRWMVAHGFAARRMVADHATASPSRTPRRSVLSSFEEALAEMTAVEEQRRALVERFGTLPAAMEDLFALQHKEIKERRLRDFPADVEELMGTEARNGH